MRDLFHERKSLVTWWQRITMFLRKDLNPRTITGTLSWFKISPLTGYNLIRVRTRIRRRWRWVRESSSSRHERPRLFYGQFIRIWQIFWRIIMDSSNVHALSLRNKRNCRTIYTTSKRGKQPHYCNRDWMTSGCQILWNAVAICEISKTSWQTGKLRMNEDLGNLAKGPIIPFEALVEYLPKFRERQSWNSSIRRESVISEEIITEMRGADLIFSN